MSQNEPVAPVAPVFPAGPVAPVPPRGPLINWIWSLVYGTSTVSPFGPKNRE